MDQLWPSDGPDKDSSSHLEFIASEDPPNLAPALVTGEWSLEQEQIYMPSSASVHQSMDRSAQEGEMQSPDISQTRQSHKRKRESPGVNGRAVRQATTPDSRQRATEADMGTQHPYYSQSNGSEEYSIQQQVARHVANHNASSSTAAAALAASMPQLTVPQPTELSFPSTNSGNEEDRQVDSSFDIGQDSTQHHSEGGSYNHFANTNGDQTQSSGGNGHSKPAVGTEEWHKVRKDNHKEGASNTTPICPSTIVLTLCSGTSTPGNH